MGTLFPIGILCPNQVIPVLSIKDDNTNILLSMIGYN